MRYIHKIGWELEGSFPDSSSDIFEELGDLTSDGSIHNLNNPAEFRSNPGNLSETKKTIRKVIEKIGGANETCGFHLHFSFERQMYYGMLASGSFYYNYCKDVKKEFPELRERLENNEYCAEDMGAPPIYRIQSQIEGEGTRYTAINYCLGKHGTIEFRLFPALAIYPDYVKSDLRDKEWVNDNFSDILDEHLDIDPDRITQYVEFTVNYIQNYLDSKMRKLDKFHAPIPKKKEESQQIILTKTF